LLKFYLNTPEVREGVEMKPYLGDVEKHIADITEDKRREWLEAEFKHMYSNRPRHMLPYEIYNWERIYKIKHKTRPLDARRRPFELENVRPMVRRYDEGLSKYIPKKFREPGRYRKKFEDTYYP
jgi:small subunit ribosomal protein S30